MLLGTSIFTHVDTEPPLLIRRAIKMCLHFQSTYKRAHTHTLAHTHKRLTREVIRLLGLSQAARRAPLHAQVDRRFGSRGN